MATSILSSLSSKPALSIVSNQTQIEYGTNLNVEKVRLRYTALPRRHMREDGTSIVDSKTVMPCVIEVFAFCKTLDDLALINSILLDRQSGYVITSKGIVNGNMMADENTIRQTPECISANPIVLTFKQVLVQDGKTANQVRQAADSQTITAGIVACASAELSSLATTVSNFASTAVTTVEGAFVDATGNTFTLDSSKLS